MDEKNNELFIRDSGAITEVSKYEIPTLDRTLSQEFQPPIQCPVSPIGMGTSSRFTETNIA